MAFPSLDAQDTEGWTEDKINVYLGWRVPEGWQYRLRYTYDETIKPARWQVTSDNYMDQNGAEIMDQDGHPIPIPEPAREWYTAFDELNPVPEIFRWGTPLPSGPNDANAGLRNSPCLLRVEKTERATGQSTIARTSYTGYMYATPLDEGPRFIDNDDPNATHPAIFKDRAAAPQEFFSHFNPLVTPKLRHIFRDEQLRAAMVANGGSSINSIFDPTPEPDPTTGAIPRNRRSYSTVANVSLDWRSLARGYLSGSGSATSLWVIDGLIGQCVLNQVERGRMFVRDRSPALVRRVRLRASGADDGVYDLMYMGVSEATMYPQGRTSWEVTLQPSTTARPEQGPTCAL
jgi:hypothetical protein